VPIYVYECENGHEFEVMQKMDDAEVSRCRICSGWSRRKVSRVYQLKGAGVYLFDKRFGARDILHDPVFSESERAQIVSQGLAGIRTD